MFYPCLPTDQRVRSVHNFIQMFWRCPFKVGLRECRRLFSRTDDSVQPVQRIPRVQILYPYMSLFPKSFPLV